MSSDHCCHFSVVWGEQIMLSWGSVNSAVTPLKPVWMWCDV
jgi:hypothetical protein